VHLLRGAHGVVWAWEARGQGRASTVAGSAWPDFHGRLARAEDDLREAARLDPPDPTPWLHLLRSGRGLQVGTAELRRRYDEAESRHPRGWLHNYQYLQGIALKWGGSHEEMFAFARGSASAAPDGSPVIALVAAGHFEVALDLQGLEAKRAYFSHPEVADEIMELARRSVLSPDWVDDHLTVGALNHVAAALAMSGQTATAEQLGVRIGTRRSQMPWSLMPSADRLFALARAGQPVGRLA